jgi:hypothetical protein
MIVPHWADIENGDARGLVEEKRELRAPSCPKCLPGGGFEMNILSKILSVFALAAVLEPFACSGEGGGGPVQCLEALVGSATSTCLTCQTTSCSAQANTAQTACADYLNCICSPAGTLEPGNIVMCAPKLAETGCSTAETSLETCLHASCASACGGGGGSAGSGGSGGTSGAGGTSGSGSATVSCYHGPTKTASGNCMMTINVPSAAVPTLNSDCTSLQGTPGTICQTDSDLLGCCTIKTPSAESEACYYADTSSGKTAPGVSAIKMSCTMEGATYSATP